MKRLLPRINVWTWATEYDAGPYVETLYEGRSLSIRWLGLTLEICIGKAGR